MTTDNEKFIGINSRIFADASISLKVEADGWGILYNPATDFSFGINPVSVFIWNQLADNPTVREITLRVKENCTGVPDSVADDVLEFLENILKKELIRYE